MDADRLTRAQVEQRLTDGKRTFGAVDLTDADLAGLDLSNCSLRGATLRNANLRGASLQRADFQGAQLPFACLDDADLEHCNLTKTNCAGVSGRNANLRRAQLQQSRLNNARLDGARCPKVDFRDAQIIDTSFRGADLSYAIFNGAELGRVNFRKAILRETDFTGAKLRGIRYGALDECITRGVLWDPRGTGIFRAPLWRQLRTSYTGARTAFHFFFLLVFLTPFALRTAYWLGVNRTQRVIETVGQRLEPRRPDSGLVIAFPQLTACLDRTCKQTRVGWLVLGVERGIGVWLPAALLLVYNLFRMALTWTLGPMRDEEDYSGRTPAWERYRWLGWLHWAFTALFTYAVIHGAIVVFRHLAEPVWLPAN